MTTGDEVLLAQGWIYDTLTADTAFNTASPGGVWDGVVTAAAGASPWTVFSAQSPGVVVGGVGAFEVMVNQLWLIRTICEGGSFATLRAASNRVYALLHGKNYVARPTGTILSCIREETFRSEEVRGGREFRHLGGIYRIYAQS